MAHRDKFEIVYVDKYNKGYEIRMKKDGSFVSFHLEKETAQWVLSQM